MRVWVCVCGGGRLVVPGMSALELVCRVGCLSVFCLDGWFAVVCAGRFGAWRQFGRTALGVESPLGHRHARSCVVVPACSLLSM